MSAGRYCASCGAPREPNARFCAKCGASLEAAASNAARPAPAPTAAPTPEFSHRRSAGPPWKRIAALAVGLVVLVAVVAAIAEPTPPEEPRLALGTATAKEPAADRIVATKEWGVAPADQILVQLRPGLARADAERVAQVIGGTIVGEVALLGLYQLETTGRAGADLVAALTKIRGVDGVLRAAANQILIPADDVKGARCDPLLDGLYQLSSTSGKLKGHGADWNMVQIGMRGAWNVIAASGLPFNKVKVGLLDSGGVLSSTNEFNGSGVKLTGDTTTTPHKDRDGSPLIGGIGHSTAVAHVALANPGNAGVVGVGGVLKGNAELLSTNVFRVENRAVSQLPEVPGLELVQRANNLAFSMSAIVGAMDQVDRGAKVVNMSFGAGWSAGQNAEVVGIWRDFLTRMAADPRTKDVLFVASAGNSGKALDGTNHLPGGLPLPNLITVGSTDVDGNVSAFSNRAGAGAEVTLAAPAEEIVVGVDQAGKPIVASGTSFAAPQVTGAAALLRSLDPTLSPADIKDILVRTGTTALGSVRISADVGGRVLAVDRAVQEVVNRLRAKTGLPALTVADAEKLATIDVTANQKDALTWTLVANVAATGEKGTDVKLEWTGQGGPSGGSTRHATGATGTGTSSWTYTFIDTQGSASVTVTRADTGGCARVSFKAGGATPTATVARTLTVRQILESVVPALGWAIGPNDRADRNRWNCSGDGWCQLERRDSYAKDVRTTITVMTVAPSAAQRDLEALLAKPTTGLQIAKSTYRGLIAFTSSSTSSDRSLVSLNVASGGVEVRITNTWLCPWTEAQVKAGEATCRNPGTPSPTREMDAVLKAAVDGGLVPASALK